MGKKRLSVRLNERDIMILSEMADKYQVKISSIVRSLIVKGIDEAIDSEGNLLNEKSLQDT